MTERERQELLQIAKDCNSTGCQWAGDEIRAFLAQGERPDEGEDCEFCNGDGIIRGKAPGGKVVEVAYCPNQCKSSSTEGERELLPFVLGILEDFENKLTGGGAGRSDEEHRIRENHADRILALLAQSQDGPPENG